VALIAIFEGVILERFSTVQ